MRVLIMGLPGSGKTTMAARLRMLLDQVGLSVRWLNADSVRSQFNDWDFSREGRIRQSRRMFLLAEESAEKFVLCDFVAPLIEMRDVFDPDWTIWMDTVDSSRFEDTDKLFVPPARYDFRVTEKDAGKWAGFIADHLIRGQRRPVFDWGKETVQMLGRFQPWHTGHRALFERALAKTGQVVIQVRMCQGWLQSNPFDLEQVKERIRRDLDPDYQGRYEIQAVPNIVNITYGRDVGYSIEQEFFDEEITNISATKIRKEMGL